MTSDIPESQAEALELVNAEVTARLARQSLGGAQIDTKAIVLVGAASAFLATRHFQPVLAAMAFAAYAGAAAAGLRPARS